MSSFPLPTPCPCHVDRPRQKAFRDYLRQIPTRLLHHNKSSSDSTLHPRPAKKVLRHRGVSFEILSPRDKFATSVPYNGGIDAPPSRSFTEYPVSDASTTNMAYAFSPISVSDSYTTDGTPTRRPTPVRALFQDLPTAHSSITSRTNDSGRRAVTDPDLYNNKPRYFPSKPLPNWESFGNGHYNRQDAFAISSQPRDPYDDRGHVYSLETARDITETQSDVPGETFRAPPASGLLAGTTSRPQQKPLPLYFPGRVTSTESKCIRRRRKRSRLVKKAPSNKTKRQKMSPAHRRRSAICPRVRPILNNFLNRHQPSPHAVRGRIGKPETTGVARRREYNSARHAKVIDGYFYSSRRMNEFSTPDPETAITTSGIKQVSVPKDTTPTTSVLKDSPAPDFSRSVPHGIQTHLSMDFPRSQPLQKPSCKHSVSSPNFSGPVDSDISPITTPVMGSPAASPVSPLAKHYEPESLHEDAPHVQSPSKSARSGDCIGDIVDHYYYNGHTGPTGDIQELDPGSSQTTSTTGLSQHTVSSGALRPRIQLPAATSPRSVETDTCSRPSLMVSPLYSANRDRNGTHETHQQNGTSLDDLREMDNEANAEEDDDLDWETVAGSQQFGSVNHLGLVHSDTGSSLANYSTFGSLANREVGSFASMRASSYFQDYQSAASPLQNEVASPGHFSCQYYTANSSREDPRSSKPLSGSIPSLSASTRKCPVPMPQSSSLYRHPSPLGGAHAHPFRSNPPSLLTDQPDQSKAPRSNPIAAIRSSKSSFHDIEPPAEGDSSAVMDKQRDGRMESPTFPCPYPIHQFGLHPHENTPCFQLEHVPNTPNTQVSHEGQSFRHSRNLSSISATLPAAIASKADDKSDEDSVSVNENPEALNSRRSALTPNEEPNDPRYEDPVRSESTEPLINEHSARKFPPGSLYLSIRSAGSQGARNSNKRSHRPNRRVTFSGTALTYPSPIKESRFSSPSANVGSSSEQESGPAHRKSISGRSLLSPSRVKSPHAACNGRGRRTSRNSSQSRDQAVRERLERLDTSDLTEFASTRTHSRSSRPAAIPLSSLPPQVRESLSAGNGHTLTSTGAASSTAYSPSSGWDEESTLAPPEWYCSADGQYAFSEPPRLFQAHERRSLRATTEYLVMQRNLGRQLILWGSLAFPPLGWIVVIFIGFGDDRADALMRWRSRSMVAGFHERERKLAKLLGVGFALAVFLTAVITASVLLAVL